MDRNRTDDYPNQEDSQNQTKVADDSQNQDGNIPGDSEIKVAGGHVESSNNFHRVDDGKKTDPAGFANSQDENDNSSCQDWGNSASDEEDLSEEDVDEVNAENSPVVRADVSLEEALKKKAEANELYKDSKFLRACSAYTEAIEYCPIEESETVAILLNNRAAAQIMLEAYEEAVSDATDAIELNDKFVRAYLRRSKANEHLKKYNDVVNDLNKAIELDPTLVGQYGGDLRRFERLAKEQFEKEKEEVVGKMKDFGNWALGKMGLSLDNFKVEQNPDSGSYNISFQQDTGKEDPNK
eukprot:Lankesteria_metandrocarpae@DN5081_c0_g2_i2.p1